MTDSTERPEIGEENKRVLAGALMHVTDFVYALHDTANHPKAPTVLKLIAYPDGEDDDGREIIRLEYDERSKGHVALGDPSQF